MQGVFGRLQLGSALRGARSPVSAGVNGARQFLSGVEKSLNHSDETRQGKATTFSAGSGIPPSMRELIQAKASRSFWAETHVDAVQDDGLVINGLVFKSSALLLLPHFVLSVSGLTRLEDLQREHLCFLELIRPTPMAFIIGMNQSRLREINSSMPRDVDRYLREHLGLSYECTNPIHACATFNFLNEERRSPAALIMLRDASHTAEN
jgi:uncharacterized protein